MRSSVVETSVGLLGCTSDGGAVILQEQIIPDNPAQVFDQRPGEREIVRDTAPEVIELERVVEKKQHREVLEGKDAALNLRLSIEPGPVGELIDTPSLQLKLAYTQG